MSSSMTPSSVLAKLGIAEDAPALQDSVEKILQFAFEKDNPFGFNELNYITIFPDKARFTLYTDTQQKRRVRLKSYNYFCKTNLEVTTAIMQWGAE